MAAQEGGLVEATATQWTTREGAAFEEEGGVAVEREPAWVSAPDHAAAAYLCQKVHAMPHLP